MDVHYLLESFLIKMATAANKTNQHKISDHSVSFADKG